MRVWDIDPTLLCRQHLLGEHREIHAIFNILSGNKSGYRHHPEVKRWEDRLGDLKARHDKVVREMRRRGYRHRSPISTRHTPRGKVPFVQTVDKQVSVLRGKGCACEV